MAYHFIPSRCHDNRVCFIISTEMQLLINHNVIKLVGTRQVRAEADTLICAQFIASG